MPAVVILVLLAAVLAALMGVVLIQASLLLSLGIGLCLAVVIVAVASNELALYLLIFSMLLGPQVGRGTGGAGALMGRGMTFRLDDVLLVVVGLAWLAKTALNKDVGRVFRAPLSQPLAAYASIAVVSTALGIVAGRVNPVAGSLFTLKYIQYFVIYFMVVNNLGERKRFVRFLVAILATAAIVSVIGILQIPSGERVSAPFEGSEGEPNTFGGYLTLMLALVAGLYLTSESLGMKFYLVAAAGEIMLPLLFTLSRSSYLAVVALLFAVMAFSERKRLVVALCASTLVIAPFLMPQSVIDRVFYTFAPPYEQGQMQIGDVRLDASTSARLDSWKQTTFEGWLNHPVLGYGVTGYRFVDAQYPRVLAETGLLGFFAFLWLQVSLFRKALTIFKMTRDPLYRGVALGFLAGFVAMIAHSIGSNTFIIVRIMEPFWFLAGMVMLIPELEASQVEPDAVSEPAGPGNISASPIRA